MNERTLLGEDPIDQNNHALGALRYLITRLDANRLARPAGALQVRPCRPRPRAAR